MLIFKNLDHEERYYHATSGTKHHWILKGLEFSDLTIIAGLNASGKTRTCNILLNTVKKIVMPQKILQIGKTKLIVNTPDNTSYRIIIDVEEDENRNVSIKREELYEIQEKKDKMLFNRTIIHDSLQDAPVEYHPPDDSLTFHARRDKVSYSYLEDIMAVLKKFHFFDVQEEKGLITKIAGVEGLPLIMLPSSTSSAFEMASESQKKEIIDDLNSLGFPIKNMFIKPMPFGDIKIPVLLLDEKGVKGIYEFVQASSGMLKVIFLIICLHLAEKGSCILVDNVGDGLDHKRSVEIVKYLEKFKEDKQIILSTNNEILLNQIDIRNWNILHRQGHIVKAFNYSNSKERLEKFAKTGLSNYEYFQDEYFLES